MLGDPITLVITGGNVSFAKINQDGYSSEYMNRGATYAIQLKIRHSKTKARPGVPSRDRHNVEYVATTFATAEAAERVRKCYLVIEQDADDTDTSGIIALANFVLASSAALVPKLMSWES